MKLKEDVQATGQLSITLYGPDGQVKDHREVKNLVVTKGKEFIASRMVSEVTKMSHMGIGTGSTAPVPANTGLVSEAVRVALTSSNASGANAVYSATFGAGQGTGSIVEAGLFDAASGGNMAARTVFGVITKGADDVMSITWTIQVG